MGPTILTLNKVCSNIIFSKEVISLYMELWHLIQYEIKLLRNLYQFKIEYIILNEFKIDVQRHLILKLLTPRVLLYNCDKY